MARVTFIPFNQSEQDEQDAVKAERRALRTGEAVPVIEPNLDADWEFQSIENFVEYKLDNEETEFTHIELGVLNRTLGVRVGLIREMLEAWGLKLKLRAFENSVRGFTANPNDRWQACPSHGGGGGGAIMGMAD